ncbi:MAG: DUF799 family lipoprotein [Verrucomicrobiota bacterium]
MKIARHLQSILLAAAALCLAGCEAPKPYDYTNYRAHPPRSILVLPPLNETTSVDAPYSYLSTVTAPVAELGYYVFPVQVVDHYMKENGLPGPAEMHEVPLSKFVEILGADAVMYPTLTAYGTKYQVVNSASLVSVKARLVDCRTGILLWEGAATVQANSGGSGNIIADAIAALITQAVNSSTDAAHDLCSQANFNLFYQKNYGLLYGPYSPLYGKDGQQ